MVVDGHMHVLPVDNPEAVTAVARDPVLGPADTPQLLEIRVQPVSGGSMLIALDGRRRRGKIALPAEPESAQDAAYRGPADAAVGGDAGAGPALAPKCDDEVHHLRSRGRAAARSESCDRGAGLDGRYRLTHLAAVLALTM